MNNNDTILGAFATDFEDEREIVRSVDIGLYLWDKKMERECGGITSDVVIVGNNVYDYVEDRVACAAINKYVFV